jgi:predicted O-methyltransferase YrrM
MEQANMTLRRISKENRLPRLWRAALAVLWLASLMMTTGVSAAQENKNADQAQTRLDWMRENQPGMWNISPREGLYLYDLVVKHHLKSGLEIGTSNGYSGTWIASAMGVTGGHLLTLEINEERAKLARENFHAAGVEPYVTLERADALEEIPKLTGPYDFIFIDAWKQDYVRYLDLVLPLVEPGGVIVAHNVKDMPDQLKDFIEKVKTSHELKTTFADPGPGGFSISIKRRAEE